MLVYRTSSLILVHCVSRLFPWCMFDEKRQTAEDLKKVIVLPHVKSISPSPDEADKFWKDHRHLCIVVSAYSLQDEFIQPLQKMVAEFYKNNPHLIPDTVKYRRMPHGSKVSDAARQLCRVRHCFEISL